MRTQKFELSSCGHALGNRRGQSLMIALLVMFALVFMGGLFVTLLGRNITQTKRSGETITADYLADVGVRYASDQLTYGSDLADWRPLPEYPEIVRCVAQGKDPETELADNLKPRQQDPDRYWLMQGYCRFTYGTGRFLLRVTYNPINDDPTSKFIKIESVGRSGVVDPADPTTLAIKQPMRLHRYKVAYKSIGITDYARFVTNKDFRPGDFELGTPGYITSFGEQANGGGSIRVNGNLMWYGTNYLWLKEEKGDSVQVAGDIKYSVMPYSSLGLDEGANEVIINSLSNSNWVYVNNNKVLDSASTVTRTDSSVISAFDTNPIDATHSRDKLGLYRDGRSDLDHYDRQRSISRLDAPIIESSQPIGGLNAYREMTKNSGQLKKDADGEWYNTGKYGYGDGLYIDNFADIQPESGMYTLKGDWTKPGSSGWWVGPYYIPPGVNIELTPYDLDNDAEHEPDIIITHDTGPNQPEFTWRDENGNPLTPHSETIIMPYPKNGVIFAEGNVRIKGTLGKGKHVTVVSAASVYIDGNILKYQTTNPEDDRGSIALLATDYACVNTTQFFGPTREVLVPDSGGKSIDVSPERTLWLNFAFGADIDQYLYMGVDNTMYPTPLDLYLRHSNAQDQAGLSYINMVMNYWTNFDIDPNLNPQADPNFGLYKFDNDGSRSDYTYILGNPAVGWRDDILQLWPERYAPLSTDKPYYNFYTDMGVYNRIGFQIDQTAGSSLGVQDYLLARAAVQPSDVRIEALIYAQNQSFFVIAGDWFNPDPQDTTANFLATNRRPASVGDDNYSWPFHGDPLDVKITIYGAISENIPASIGESSSWMEKWGWIPPIHGAWDQTISPLTDKERSQITVYYRDPLDPNDPQDQVTKDNGSGTQVTIPQRGLTFAYDNQLSCPRMDPNASPSKPLRTDEYDRMLPVAPRLPVSRDTLYFGEPT